MGVDVQKISAEVTRFWENYGALVILGTGVFALLLVSWALWRFSRTGNKSKVVSTIAAVVVMLWTSEGLLAVTVGEFGVPWQFAGVAFFVFEAMMLAAAMKAEENRRERGLPGAAGQYVFVIAVTSGVISAFGAETVGEIVLRVILPPLAVGLWWILLVSDRDDDSEEIQEKRRQKLAEREATWAITWTTLLVRWGVKKPGRSTTTAAQREHLRDRMVALADQAETLNKDSRRRKKLVRKLRVLTRNADEALVAEVAERVDRARRAEELMIAPSATRAGASSPGGPEADQLNADLSEVRQQLAELAHDRKSLQDVLAEREVELAEAQRRLTDAEQSDALDVELDTMRARVAQLEHQREQDRAAVTAANAEAQQHRRRAEQLEAQLADVMAEVRKVAAELEKARQNEAVDERIEQLVDALEAGEQLTGSTVAARFDIAPRTANRWIKKAGEVLEARKSTERPSLQVVRGR